MKKSSRLAVVLPLLAAWMSGCATSQNQETPLFKPGQVYYQAHRGGGVHEAPDNTLAAVHYGWRLGGIPEVDIRLTADDKLICLHDDTLARTTDAPEAIRDLAVRELEYAQIREWDAGKKFAEKFAGEYVPELGEVFAEMQNRPGRLLYADIKNYDPENFPLLLRRFAEEAAAWGVAPQVIACSNDYALNCRIKEAVPGIRVMQWIGDWGANPRAAKMAQFNALRAKNFAGLDQVQLHLNWVETAPGDWPYDWSRAELLEALKACREANVALQVFPFQFTGGSVKDLLNIGICHFVTDEPARFAGALLSAGVKVAEK